MTVERFTWRQLSDSEGGRNALRRLPTSPPRILKRQGLKGGDLITLIIFSVLSGERLSECSVLCQARSTEGIGALGRWCPALPSHAQVLLRNSFNCYGEFPVSLSWFSCCYCDTILTKKGVTGKHPGKPEQDLEAETTKPTTHLLPLSYSLTQTPDHLHREGCPPKQARQATSMSSQDRPPQRGLWANLIWTAPRLRLPSQVTDCKRCQVDITS